MTTTFVTILFGASLASGPVGAAEPASGLVGPGRPTVSWTGPEANAATRIDGPDEFCLTVDVPLTHWETHDGHIEVEITWEDETDDFTLDVYETQDCIETGDLAGFSESPPPGKSERVVVREPFGRYIVRVLYDTVVDSGYSGRATFTSQATRTGPPVIFDAQPLEFAPATVVSAHFLGTEPMVTMERPVLSSKPGAIDPNRIFVDWPLSSRTEVSQLSRSTDGGNSFRLLYDPLCAPRSRPTCFTGGGGDTVTDVNLVDGTLYFADQEFLAGHEALASSTDHGDSFSRERQHVITNPTGITDRQWLASAGNAVTTAETAASPATDLGAFLAYRQGIGSFFIQGIRKSDGFPLPQPVPQLENVFRSGPLRVDTTGGPGRGWLYQPYVRTEPDLVTVATAKGSEYQDPSAWIAPEAPVWDGETFLFPWLDLDSRGNAYLVWTTGTESPDPADTTNGVVMYSASDIDLPVNDPSQGGRPGSSWTEPARVSLPDIGSAVFSEVVAGEDGRIAISYLGTKDHTGASDFADSATWDAYAAVVSNAQQSGGQPAKVTTGKVSHRPVHRDRICTGGLTACTGPGADRSLADMIDIGLDGSGRVGVVYGDNYSGFGSQVSSSSNPDEAARPFAHFAQQVSGPSLIGGQDISVAVPSGQSVDAAGDATWPNQSGGALLPSLDARSLDVRIEGNEIVARLSLADADFMSRDLAAHNAAKSKDGTDYPDAERLQYIVRLVTDQDIFHLSAESLGGAPVTLFGGKLGPNDTMRNPDGYILGAAYKPDPGFGVTGSVENDTLVLRAPLAALNLGTGSRLYSVTAFTTVGPLAENESLTDPMRTVDATPPFDMVVGTQPTPTPSLSPSPSVTTSPSPTTGPSPDPDPPGGTACDVVGTPGNDYLEGTAAGETICGRGGNDVLIGAGGADILRGGRGTDRLFGGGGADRLNAGSGADAISGGPGADTLRGGRGDDTLRGGLGRDLLFGGDGRDRLDGGPGRDRCRVGKRERITGCEGRSRP